MDFRRCVGVVAAALLLLQLAAVLPAAAASSRSLKTLYSPSQYDPWSGNNWGWGGSWYGRRPYDPVGSGCYHPETYTRYRSGQAAYCSNGNRLMCNMGSWLGSCRYGESYDSGSSNDWGGWRRRQ